MTIRDAIFERVYNCTGIYIELYRQSFAFGDIYIDGHSVACEGEPQKDLQKWHMLLLAAVLNIMLCSLDVSINIVSTTASDKGQEQC